MDPTGLGPFVEVTDADGDAIFGSDLPLDPIGEDSIMDLILDPGLAEDEPDAFMADAYSSGVGSGGVGGGGIGGGVDNRGPFAELATDPFADAADVVLPTAAPPMQVPVQMSMQMPVSLQVAGGQPGTMGLGLPSSLGGSMSHPSAQPAPPSVFSYSAASMMSQHGGHGGMSMGGGMQMPLDALTSQSTIFSAVSNMASGPSPNSLVGGDDDEDRRLKRLARNRESARQSRLRKKQHLAALQQKVGELTVQVDELRRMHLANAETSLRHARHQLLTNAQANIQHGLMQDPQAVRDLRDALLGYGPNCEQRVAMRDYYFDQLEHLLLPAHTKLMLYLISQSDSFFGEMPAPVAGVQSPTTDSHAIWSSLCTDLGLVPEQERKLKVNFQRLLSSKQHSAETRRLYAAVNFLSRFRNGLTKRAETVEHQTRQLHSCLTPEQSVRYFLWAEEHRQALLAGMSNMRSLCTTCRDEDASTAAASTSSSAGSSAASAAGPVAPQVLAQLLEKPSATVTQQEMNMMLPD